MATNYVQPGDTITIPAPAATASGSVVVVGDIIGVAAGDAASGALLDIETKGVWSLPKVAADVVTVGAAIYYDAGESLVTIDDAEGANAKIGVAIAAAGNGAATVTVRLSGF
jgi:predicted RecA/RadA family phage recombinase